MTPEALELGLLMGAENITVKEEETEVLCFTHLMLQEFAAGKYISELPKVHISQRDRRRYFIS